MGRFGCCVLICLASWLTAAQVWAEENAVRQAEQIAEDARIERESQRFTEAIRLYLQAHDIQPDAAFLYNVAFIYDRDLGDVLRAKRYYQECIEMAGADRRLVQRSRDRLELLKARREAKPRLEPSPIGIRDPMNASGASRESSTGASWLTLLGGMALVAGGVTGLVARHDAEQFREAKLLDEKLAFRDRAESQALLADGLMLGGAVTLIAGVTWLVLTTGDDASPTAIQFSPAGVMVKGRFE